MRAADDEPSTLGEVIDRSEIENVSDDFRVPSERVAEWKELKAKKRIRRTHKISGEEYFYAEGNIPFPDNLDQPSRTILTGEGGTSPSRFKHIVEDPRGGYRRLTPEDLELLNLVVEVVTEDLEFVPVLCELQANQNLALIMPPKFSTCFSLE